MSDTQRWQRHPEVSWRIVEGEAILINPVKGRTLVLNGSGASLWSWIDNSSEAELAEKLAAEFDIEADKAAGDVKAFMDELRREELIQPA